MSNNQDKPGKVISIQEKRRQFKGRSGASAKQQPSKGKAFGGQSWWQYLQLIAFLLLLTYAMRTCS